MKFLSLLVAGWFLLNAASVLAQPGASSVEEYQQWMAEEYVPQREGLIEEMIPTVEGLVSSVNESPRAIYWLGNDPAEAQDIAEEDEFILREQFEECNDGLISNPGDPEENFRQNVSCDQQTGFFDPPNIISFHCPSLMTSSGCGDDRDTGMELIAYCALTGFGACGIHYDNPHPGRGGMIGIAEVSPRGGDPDGPFGPCRFSAVTATFVEYYFPWTLINVSRGAFQSAYYSKENVKDLLPIAREEIAMTTQIELGSSIELVKQALKNNVTEGIGEDGETPLENNQELISKAVAAVEALPEEMRNGLAQNILYGRNLSTTWDLRMQQYVYSSVPHYPLEHRFGTDLPASFQPVEIPMPTGTFEPVELMEAGMQGGVLHGRFTSILQRSGGLLGQNAERLIAPGGPNICLKHGMATGKIPPNIRATATEGEDNRFLGLSPQDDDSRFCLRKIGARFPPLIGSFAGPLGEVLWKAYAVAGHDLFYAINFPEHYNYGAQDPLPEAVKPGVYHTYLEEIDRITVNPNPRATDPDFAAENPGCKPLKDMVKFGSDFLRANIEDPLWGAHNTFHVWGFVKGMYGFRGAKPHRVYQLYPSRHPNVALRFR